MIKKMSLLHIGQNADSSYVIKLSLYTHENKYLKCRVYVLERKEKYIIYHVAFPPSICAFQDYLSLSFLKY